MATLRRLCSSTSEHLPAALRRRDGQGHTLMHWAAKSGDVAMLELLASEYGAVMRLVVLTCLWRQRACVVQLATSSRSKWGHDVSRTSLDNVSNYLELLYCCYSVD